VSLGMCFAAATLKLSKHLFFFYLDSVMK